MIKMDRIDVSVDLIAIWTACVGGIAFVYNKVIRPAYRNSKDIIDSLQKINAIHEQMFTNGGKTLRDAVNRIENRLTMLEKQQAIYIMDTDEGVFQSDDKGQFIYVNRTLCRMTGMTERELMGNGWINCVAEWDRERVDESWDYAIENHIELVTVFDIVPREGKKEKVRCTANPLKTIDGKLIGYMGIIDTVYG